MAVYKDNATGTWRVIYRFTNWKGERKQTQKRGFATKREAQAWEHEAMLKQGAKLDMTFGSFFEVYEADKKQRVKESTWESKSHVIRTKILPYFENRKIAEIEAKDVIAWQNELMAYRDEKGMTQKQLGEILGFLGKTSDVRMAQYETEARTPKHDLVKEMANIFDVSTHALTVPDIDTYTGLMHTLFALEDMYGLKIGEIDGEICLRLDKSDYSTYTSMFDMFHAWQEQAAKLEQGEITKEEYDQWRYKYPELDTSKHWAKVPSQAVSDMLMEEFQKIEKEEKKTAKKKKQK